MTKLKCASAHLNKKTEQKVAGNSAGLGFSNKYYGQLAYAAYLSSLFLLFTINSAYADWFNIAAVKKNIIDTTYTLVLDNIGYAAFAIGGFTTFFARGGDMWQKAIMFGVGSFGTGASVLLAKSMLNLE